MNDTILTELKEHINKTIAAHNRGLRAEINTRFTHIDKKFAKVHSHMAHMQNFIGETFDTSNNTFDAVLTDHEARLFDLETDNDTAGETGLFTTVKRQNYNTPRTRELVR